MQFSGGNQQESQPLGGAEKIESSMTSDALQAQEAWAVSRVESTGSERRGTVVDDVEAADDVTDAAEEEEGLPAEDVASELISEPHRHPKVIGPIASPSP